MSNRILLTSDFLRVSAPGADVYTVDSSELNFDSDFAYPEISESGIIHLTRNKVSTYYFAKTYSSLPLLFISVYGIPDYGATNGSGYFSIVGDSVTTYSGAPGYLWYQFKVYSDRFVFSNTDVNDVYVYYKLFDLNMA